jgi:UDP-2,4-diacetamido-2,4,6-trideoxy-beta-L-altropyranose hydrolase
VSGLTPAGGVRLRAATATDCERVWVWRNDPETRAASLDGEAIPWEVHEPWFNETLRRKDRHLYIVVADGRDAGAVRLDVADAEALVNIHLAPEARYRGVGALALRAVVGEAFDGLGLARVIGVIKPDNQSSLAAFAKAGFALVEGDNLVTAVKSTRELP